MPTGTRLFRKQGGSAPCHASTEDAFDAAKANNNQNLNESPAKAHFIWFYKGEREEKNGGGARYRVRTCDPYRVKVVLYH